MFFGLLTLSLLAKISLQQTALVSLLQFSTAISLFDVSEVNTISGGTEFTYSFTFMLNHLHQE